MHKKAVSKTTVLSLITIMIIALIFYSLFSGFSKKVEKTEQTSSVGLCRLSGTTNYCCEPYSPNEITPKESGWKDCEEPESACCIG
ncbi:hypothetical protein KY366_01195 [Candidatus Woesearchaeota archaeon]|nr:hypothetical protein [Candidatus Woesearchaeota archaeon]